MALSSFGGAEARGRPSGLSWGGLGHGMTTDTVPAKQGFRRCQRRLEDLSGDPSFAANHLCSSSESLPLSGHGVLICEVRGGHWTEGLWGPSEGTDAGTCLHVPPRHQKGKRVKGKPTPLSNLHSFQTHFTSHEEQTYYKISSSFEIILLKQETQGRPTQRLKQIPHIYLTASFVTFSRLVFPVCSRR